MAKKKKAGKSRSRKTSRGRTVAHIFYECVRQGPTDKCSVSDAQARIGNRNSPVVLTALGTSVTLTFFETPGSPFRGRRRTLTIGADRSRVMHVDAAAVHTAYPYDLTCSKCGAHVPPAPPEMIVP